MPVDLPGQLHEHLHSANYCFAMPTNLPEHLPVLMPTDLSGRRPLSGRVIELQNEILNIILILDFSRRLLLAADALLDILSADLRAAADDKRSIVRRAMRSSRARRFHQSDVSNPAFCMCLTGNSMRSK